MESKVRAVCIVVGFLGLLSTALDFTAKAKSIKSEDGDIIDCVDIYKQPAFDHPLLANHKIQMSPSHNPTKKTRTTGEDEENNVLTVTSQLWHRRGRCPKGTIPIRRVKEENDSRPQNDNIVIIIIRQRPIDQVVHNETQNLHQANRSLAVLVTGGVGYTGAKGDIMVWNPYVESDDEYSISSISLKNGPSFDSSSAYEAVEAGWAVNPSLYGDNQTRLFAYWTMDSSNTTGCFDLSCPGFVQVDSEMALGAAIYPFSQIGGPIYKTKFYIYKDPITNNWWLNYGGKYDVGYWPDELFGPLRYGAKVVRWGGEVYSTKLQSTPHTATGMGSGRFTDRLPGYSGSVTGIEVQRNSDELIFPEWVAVYIDEDNCYDGMYLTDYVEVPEFHYGGPGRCYRCP